MTSFTPEQSAFLSEYVKDLSKSFNDYANALDEKFAESSAMNFNSFKIENESLKSYADELSESFKNYVNKVIAEVSSINKLNMGNHAAIIKEMRISSIATIYASGCELETSCSIVQQIEELINNQKI